MLSHTIFIAGNRICHLFYTVIYSLTQCFCTCFTRFLLFSFGILFTCLFIGSHLLFCSYLVKLSYRLSIKIVYIGSLCGIIDELHVFIYYFINLCLLRRSIFLALYIFLKHFLGIRLTLFKKPYKLLIILFRPFTLAVIPIYFLIVVCILEGCDLRFSSSISIVPRIRIKRIRIFHSL